MRRPRQRHPSASKALPTCLIPTMDDCQVLMRLLSISLMLLTTSIRSCVSILLRKLCRGSLRSIPLLGSANRHLRLNSQANPAAPVLPTSLANSSLPVNARQEVLGMLSPTRGATRTCRRYPSSFPRALVLCRPTYRVHLRNLPHLSPVVPVRVQFQTSNSTKVPNCCIWAGLMLIASGSSKHGVEIKRGRTG